MIRKCRFFASLAATVLVVGLLSACASGPTPQVKHVPSKDDYIVTFPATFRAAYMMKVTRKDGLQQVVVCAEPPPDVRLSVSTKLNANGSVKTPAGVSGSVGGAFVASGVTAELSGRTQLILLTRELLFRLCEMSINYPDEKSDTVMEEYGRVINLIKNMTEADLAEAQAAKYQAQIEWVKIVATKKDKAQIIVEHFEKDGVFQSADWKKFVNESIKKSPDKNISSLANVLVSITSANKLLEVLSAQNVDALDGLIGLIGTEPKG